MPRVHSQSLITLLHGERGRNVQQLACKSGVLSLRLVGQMCFARVHTPQFAWQGSSVQEDAPASVLARALAHLGGCGALGHRPP